MRRRLEVLLRHPAVGVPGAIAIREVHEQQPVLALRQQPLRSGGGVPGAQALRDQSPGAGRRGERPRHGERGRPEVGGWPFPLVQSPHVDVSGILFERTSPQVLFDSVRSVMGGSCWLGRERLDDLAEGLRDLNPPSSNRFGLTERELEILEGVRRGDTNRTIARRLCITHDTVKHHLTNIFTKIGVCTRLQLAVFAIDHKLPQALKVGDHTRTSDRSRH